MAGSTHFERIWQALLRRHWVTLVAVGLPMLVVAWWYFPVENPDVWRQGAPPRVWAHRQQQEETFANQKPPVRTRFHYVPSEAVSTDLKLAVLVAEDAGFFFHGPVDPDAIWEAIEQWRQGRRLRGASTISQQVAKNLFTSSQRSLWRKLEELRMAYWLERHLSKTRIFELYLNIIELGPGVYGVDAASRYYFNVTAAEMDSDHACRLAAAIPAPTASNPRTHTVAYERRRAAVEERMHRLKHLRTVLEHMSRL